MKTLELTLAQIIKTTKFVSNPTSAEIIDELVKELENYPSNYAMGQLLKEIGDSLMDS